jgi:hypothetical protein
VEEEPLAKKLGEDKYLKSPEVITPGLHQVHYNITRSQCAQYRYDHSDLIVDK